MALLLFISCTAQGPVATRSDTGSLNLVAAANLAATTRIEVQSLDETSGVYLPLATIDDPTTVAALIESINQPLALQPALFCMAAYELVFHFQEGDPLLVNYGCVAEEGGFLQGEGTPLGGQSIEPPAAFHELLLP